MDPFSYLSTLTSIILALGIARILTGIGKLLQVRGQVRIYWVHLVWALNLFLYMVLIWWILYRWHAPREWDFFLFLFVLLSPIIAFLESVLLFPDVLPSDADLKQHFFANHSWFFILAACLAPLDAVDTFLKGWDHFVAQGLIYPFFLTILFITSLIAAFTTREKYHAFFAVFFLFYLVAFIGINLRVLM